MRQTVIVATCLAAAVLCAASATAYAIHYTVPASGGCPLPSRFSLATAIGRQWSTSLPSAPQTIFTVATPGSSQQTAEIQQAILDAFSAWTGVSGTRIDSSSFPGALGPLNQTSGADVCGSDSGGSLTGENSICFNQSSSAFTSGVLSFTRVFTATAAGEPFGSIASSFAGQILEADTLFRNDGQLTFATPGALAANPHSYDLESILTHELGHFFGLEHSPIWRAAMAPFAPQAGTFWGPRVSASAPAGPLRADDNTGIRVLYPDPNDSVDSGIITGRVLAANPLSLAGLPQPAANQYVTGIFGANVVAVDANTGEVMAGTLAGWSCSAGGGPPVFDGGYAIERLPLGRTYNIYIEPLNGFFNPGDISGDTLNVCSVNDSTPCITPAVNTNFVAHLRPPS